MGRSILAWLLALGTLFMAGAVQAIPLHVGDVVFADPTTGSIRHFDPTTETLSTLASGDLLGAPTDVAVDGAGQIYALQGQDVIRIDPATGAQTLFATIPSSMNPGRIAAGPVGRIFVGGLASAGGIEIRGLDPAGLQADFVYGSTGFVNVTDLALDRHGNPLFLDDFDGDVVLLDATMSTFLGGSSFLGSGTNHAAVVGLDGAVFVHDNFFLPPGGSENFARIARLEAPLGSEPATTHWVTDPSPYFDPNHLSVAPDGDLWAVADDVLLSIGGGLGGGSLQATISLGFAPTGMAVFVPEPSVASLLGLALLAATARRPARRQSRGSDLSVD